MRLIDADAFIEWIIENVSENTPYALVTKAIVISALKSKNIAPTVGGWVSMKDRYPETRHAVLVYTPHHKNIWAATMHEDGNWYIWSPGGRVLLDPDWYGQITHWMPLPEPPKEG